MAYADANTQRRDLTAGAAVLAVEIGLAAAILAGMTLSVTHIQEDSFTAIPIEEHTPTPPPPEKKRVKIEDPPLTAPMPPQIANPPLTDPNDGIIIDPPPTKVTDTGLGKLQPPTPLPTPTASSKPTFRPKGAIPKGNPGGWLSTDDYPLKAERLKHEGQTSYRLTLDAGGKVTGCTVTKSSGWDELDAAACRLLPQRARFNAARDDTGAATSGSYEGTVLWRLPPEE